MYPPGNSRRTIRLDPVRSMRSPVLEMGVASAAELDELDAAALGAFRRDLARSLNNLAYRPAATARGTRRWPRPKNPPASFGSCPRVALARLLQRIVRPGDTEFDSYLEQTGAVEVLDKGRSSQATPRRMARAAPASAPADSGNVTGCGIAGAG